VYVIFLFQFSILVSSLTQSAAGWFDYQKTSKKDKEKDSKSEKGKSVSLAKAIFDYERVPLFWGYVLSD
jgi:hypothetical protein